MSRRYAARTDTPAQSSLAEIQRLISRFGHQGFGYFQEDGREVVTFRIEGRTYKLEVQHPDRALAEFTRTPTGRSRSGNQAQEAWEQEVRRRWREIVLLLKAIFVAAAGGENIHEWLLSKLVLPNGQTVGASLLPQMDRLISGQISPARALLSAGEDIIEGEAREVRPVKGRA